MNNQREYVIDSVDGLQDWEQRQLFNQLLRHLDLQIVCQIRTELDGRNLEYDQRRYYLRQHPRYISQYGDEQ